MDVIMHPFQMVLASYAFSLGFQMTRGSYLNFKPFNCRFCTSFWFAFVVSLIPNHTGLHSVGTSLLSALAVAGTCNLLKLIEEKLEGGLIPPSEFDPRR